MYLPACLPALASCLRFGWYGTGTRISTNSAVEPLLSLSFLSTPFNTLPKGRFILPPTPSPTNPPVWCGQISTRLPAPPRPAPPRPSQLIATCPTRGFC
ncbi:hypothetical protein IWX49DRAFT_51239 [Phyllosticta citricarpa]|uniref:Secreted protein n=1 Tax=Phyllosticta citricarpa TaxID=55181 RepID=A0ABR1LBU1_9PEZI